jgi:hypothetical protein
MKKNILALVVIALVTLVLVSFTPQRLGSVKGTVNPADAATQVWLISEKDTLHAVIRNGAFEFTAVKPGSCMLIVDAVSPYKRTARTGIEVFEGSETNVGEILLDQIKKR